MKNVKIRMKGGYHTYSYNISDDKCVVKDSKDNKYQVDLKTYKNDLREVMIDSKVTVKALISKYKMSRALLYTTTKNTVVSIIKLHLLYLDIIRYNKIKVAEIEALNYLLKKRVISMSDYAKNANISREFIYQILNNADKRVTSDNVDKLKKTNDLIKNNIIKQLNKENEKDLMELSNLEFFKLIFE
ncbi:hypothetical protein [Enterococcus italicus]|uniref:hypothetical protein n=1 Tax=Enterococcus italicus TaxID=246144 RepID=UPI0008FFFF9C|nr:hypothetical protein [Enterococcus italicus]OJG58003.1 hypothetical protein RT43_GL000921 [Enterococcus italicus DSM 15952]